jgi:hypothetical protein
VFGRGGGVRVLRGEGECFGGGEGGVFRCKEVGVGGCGGGGSERVWRGKCEVLARKLMVEV